MKVASFENLKLAPIAVEEDHPLTYENMHDLKLDSFFDDILVELAFDIKSLLPSDAPLHTPSLLPSFVPMKELRKLLMNKILPDILKKYSVSIGTAEEAVSAQQDESIFNPHLSSQPIVYGTPVATKCNHQYSFPMSAPAKLNKLDPFTVENEEEGFVDPDNMEEMALEKERKEEEKMKLRRIGRAHDDDDNEFIEGEDVMEDIRDVGTFAIGSSGGKNELRIKEEEEEAERQREIDIQEAADNEIDEQGEEYAEGVNDEENYGNEEEGN